MAITNAGGAYGMGTLAHGCCSVAALSYNQGKAHQEFPHTRNKKYLQLQFKT